MTPHPSMPEWPEKWSLLEVQDILEYERGLVAAWEARCRLLAEALEAIKAFDPGDFRPLADEIKIHNLAVQALKAIGELPKP